MGDLYLLLLLHGKNVFMIFANSSLRSMINQSFLKTIGYLPSVAVHEGENVLPPYHKYGKA